MLWATLSHSREGTGLLRAHHFFQYYPLSCSGSGSDCLPRCLCFWYNAIVCNLTYILFSTAPPFAFPADSALAEKCISFLNSIKGTDGDCYAVKTWSPSTSSPSEAFKISDKCFLIVYVTHYEYYHWFFTYVESTMLEFNIYSTATVTPVDPYNIKMCNFENRS